MPEDELRPIENHNELASMQGDSEPDDRREDGEIDEIMPSRHNITIHPLDFGYNVKIGCQNFAIETVEKLIKNLEVFLNDPKGTERKWTNDKKLL